MHTHRFTDLDLYTRWRKRKSERIRKRDRDKENTMRGRRNVYNIPVSGYKAHRQRGTGMNLRHSNQALRRTMWDQAPPAATWRFQHCHLRDK